MSITFITDQASISSFNRGPVTSIFTPPASCLSTLTWEGSMYFGHQFTGYVDTACFPRSTLTAGPNAWDVYYYSPARCPLGWAQATTLTSSFGRSSIFLSLGPSTTVVVCCPSGYFYTGNDHACQSAFASTTSTLLYIYPTLNNDIWYSTDANSPSTTIVQVASTTYNIYGDGIPVWWQSSDLKAFAATTGSVSSSSTATQPSPTQPTPTLTSSSTTTPSPNGLSTGANIGIGIGIPLIVIAIGLVAFFIYSRRHGREQVARTDLQDAGGALELPSVVIIPEMYSDNEPNEPYDPYQFKGHHHELPGQ